MPLRQQTSRRVGILDMLLLVSDLHGNSIYLSRALLAAPAPFVGLGKAIDEVVPTTGPGTLVIQLGDHSFGPEVATHHYHEPWDPGVPVHLMRGNHDYEPVLQGHSHPVALYPHLYFLPDATVIEHEGRRIGIIGGADSVIDASYRKAGIDWWPSEAVSQKAIDTLVASGPLDLLLTHTAPASLIRRHCGYEPSLSEERLEDMWVTLGHPPLFCGHIHDSHEHLGATVLPFGGATLVDLSDFTHTPV